jgi:hypothetical protein
VLGLGKASPNAKGGEVGEILLILIIMVSIVFITKKMKDR